MRRLLTLSLFTFLYLFIVTVPALAYEKVQGYCEQGGIAVTVPGTTGSGSQRFQRSFQSCTVNVYAAGTVTSSTIYSDDAGTAKANPFTADSTGYWFFYAAEGRYDVRFSGGGISAPFTHGDVVIGGPTLNCNDFPGATAGVKINNCLTALPSTGGTADASLITGAQTISSNWCSGISKPFRIVFGPGSTFTVSTGATCTNIGLSSVAYPFRIEGNGARFVAASNPAHILKIFDSQYFVIDGMYIDCTAGCTDGIFIDSDDTPATGYGNITNNVIIRATSEGIRIADSIINNYEVSHMRIEGNGLFGSGHNIGLHSSNATGIYIGLNLLAASGATAPTHNVYAEAGQFTMFGTQVAGASAFDVYEGASAIGQAYGVYSESNKVWQAAAGGDSLLTTVIDGLRMGVNNSGVDVIEFLASRGLTLSNALIRGNAQVATAAREVLASNIQFLAGNGFTGTGTGKINRLSQLPLFWGTGNITTTTIRNGAAQAANAVFITEDASLVNETECYSTTGEATSVFAGCIVYRDHTLAQLSANGASGLSIRGKTNPLRQLLIGYSPTENNGTAWFQTFTSGTAFNGIAQFQPQGGTIAMGTNCASSGGTCVGSLSGSVSIAAAATTVTVTTTAVTANSQIIITEDSSLGTRLSVTCNATQGRTYSVTTRTAATSFVITTSAAPVTNPACLSYMIIN